MKAKENILRWVLFWAFISLKSVSYWADVVIAFFKMHLQMDCKNYIRVLHKTEDNRMYVCGTNAFDPECDYMVRHSEPHCSLI